MDKSGDKKGEGRLNISEKNLLTDNQTTKRGLIFTIESCGYITKDFFTNLFLQESAVALY